MVVDWPVADDMGAAPFCFDCQSPTLSVMVTKKRSTLFDEIQGPMCVDGLVPCHVVSDPFEFAPVHS